MKKKQVLAVVIAAMILGGCGHENIETPTTENTAIMQEETADETNTGLETAADAETIEEASRDVFAMDTYMSVTAYGTDAENVNAAADAAIAEIERLDSLLSTGDADSEIAKINENGSAVCLRIQLILWNGR
jgi:thiamine biosynthesis lipoprotein ApbE